MNYVMFLLLFAKDFPWRLYYFSTNIPIENALPVETIVGMKQVLLLGIIQQNSCGYII